MKRIQFIKIGIIISVFLLAVTIPINICMGYYLHAFTTCLWIFISICAYKTALLLSDSIHEILLQDDLIIKLEEHIHQTETISEEYTRKDAFIEKVCNYIKENREDVRTEDNGISGWIDDEFIEKFKNYMKEEKE